jgi:methyl-accepting chemotaxis protein
MSQLNKATQQNASASEELAATSEELSGQAEQLQQSVAFFILADGDNNGRKVAAEPEQRHRPQSRSTQGVQSAVAARAGGGALAGIVKGGKIANGNFRPY